MRSATTDGTEEMDLFAIPRVLGSLSFVPKRPASNDNFTAASSAPAKSSPQIPPAPAGFPAVSK